MTIAIILAEKGRSVVTAPPQTTLFAAAAEMIRHGIGALVVVDDDGRVVGLIAERDIVKAIATGRSEALDKPVSEHMQACSVVAFEADSVDSVMQTMTVERRRHLPVLKDGRLAGLVSIGDVVKYRIRVIEEEHQAMRDYIAQA